MNNEMSINRGKTKVTVILPSLNVAQYIAQCIESICNQTLQDIEIICVDAGSTDGTLEIIQKYASSDKRILIINSDKKSYGYQMNLGMDRACGEYIGIVETDDFADWNMFEIMYSIAKEYNVDIVKSNYYENKNGQDRVFELLAGLPYGRVIHPKEYMSLFIRKPAIWTGLYRKSFLVNNNIRFLETPGASYQDTSFILKNWIMAENVSLIKTPLLHYRIDNPGSSVKSADKVFYVMDEMLSVHQYLDKRQEKKGIFEHVIWDREALAYEWNYKRLAEELKFTFLQGIQERFQMGLRNKKYDRRLLTWSTWKMIQEVAEDPLLYLCNHSEVDLDKYIQNGVSREAIENKCRRAKIKAKILAIPELALDAVHFAKYFGVTSCVNAVLRKKRQ